MRVHRTDLVSLAFGLLFLGLSAWWLLAQILGLALPPVGWFLAGALLLVGLLGLIGALRTARHADREPADAGGPEPAAEPDRAGTGDPYRWDGPETADVRIEGPETTSAPLWGPDEAAAEPEPAYRPVAEADEWPTGAVTDRLPDAVSDRPADAPEGPAEEPGDGRTREMPRLPSAAPVSGPPAGEHRPPA